MSFCFLYFGEVERGGALILACFDLDIIIKGSVGSSVEGAPKFRLAGG